MSVFNGAAYLRPAVESILGQTYRNFEFLIVDDGSTDASRAILATYDDPQIRILDNSENIGLTRSLNRGLAAARGELIARQDADDISYPTRLAKQVAFMDQERDTVVVGTQAQIINARGRMIRAPGWEKLQSERGIRWQLMFDSPFVHTSVMFRRGVVWEQEGGYDEDFRTSQDFELWSRLALRHRLRNLPDTLVKSRQHGESVSTAYSQPWVAKVQSVLRGNLLAALPDYPRIDEWLDLWVALNNQRLYGFERSALDILEHLLLIRAMYFARYCEAKAMPEIERNVAGLLLRSALATVCTSRLGATRLTREALRHDSMFVLTTALQLAERSLRRMVTSRGAK